MTRIIQIGLGPLGIKTYRYASGRSDLHIVAAVDKAPSLVGQDLGILAGGEPAGIHVTDDLPGAVIAARPDIAVLTTVSDMERIVSQVEEIVALGIPVVSTCEELSYPWNESPELAERIDTAARKTGVAVLGTGVNPGFLMDSLPSFLTAVSDSVDKVEVNRFQDAQFRRIPFQKKIGAGLDMAEFEAKKRDGSLRHVGLTESLRFIANQLGWKLDRTEDIISPVIATEKIETKDISILQGQAAGVRQVGRGIKGGEEKIRLVFQAAVGEPESYDEIRITGVPEIHSKIIGGVNGDVATCAITLNAIRSVLKAEPGLRTMADVPMVSCHS
jgi:4-hydroxy-tetrahydrodipicolinate reductase